MLGSLFRKKPPSLQRQIDDLVACGVKLLREVTPDDLLRELSQEQYDRAPYVLTVATLAAGIPPRSKNLWFFDTERVEDHGAYVSIAEQLRDMADGDLPLTDLEDFVDVQTKKAWLAFRLDGVAHRWTCEVNDDWVDPKVMGRFATLLEARETGRRLTYLDIGGQSCDLGCFTDAQKTRLCRTTGLPWKWLK